MSVIRAADAPTFALPGVTFTQQAAPSLGSPEVCAWRITVEPGTTADESHTLSHDEVFMVTAGALRFTPDGEVLRTGDATVVRAGQPIALSNAGDTAAEAYVAIRAGFVATMADGTVLDRVPWAS